MACTLARYLHSVDAQRVQALAAMMPMLSAGVNVPASNFTITGPGVSYTSGGTNLFDMDVGDARLRLGGAGFQEYIGNAGAKTTPCGTLTGRTESAFTTPDVVFWRSPKAAIVKITAFVGAANWSLMSIAMLHSTLDARHNGVLTSRCGIMQYFWNTPATEYAQCYRYGPSGPILASDNTLTHDDPAVLTSALWDPLVGGAGRVAYPWRMVDTYGTLEDASSSIVYSPVGGAVGDTLTDGTNTWTYLTSWKNGGLYVRMDL